MKAGNFNPFQTFFVGKEGKILALKENWKKKESRKGDSNWGC